MSQSLFICLREEGCDDEGTRGKRDWDERKREEARESDLVHYTAKCFSMSNPVCYWVWKLNNGWQMWYYATELILPLFYLCNEIQVDLINKKSLKKSSLRVWHVYNFSSKSYKKSCDNTSPMQIGISVICILFYFQGKRSAKKEKWNFGQQLGSKYYFYAEIGRSIAAFWRHIRR